MTAQRLAAHADLGGKMLLGRYRIVRELAKGGMGVVYLARVEGAVGFVKPVVIKLLLPEHTEDDRIVSMFVREARILAQLRHPSLVDVLEFGEQDGGYVLVLEYVRGYHLGLWLRYLAQMQRVPAADIVLQVVIDVLDALHHAHTQAHPDGSPMQIVHRDVSPSNVLLDENGRGRLLDFGVARMRGGAQEIKTQVQGGFMGKLPYTAPEIFAGKEASPRSDLYACAVVLHEAIFGRNVFRGETQAATLQRVLSHVPEPLEPANSSVPAGLDAVLTRALAKSPDDRHEDARELATDLRKLQKEPESEIRAKLAELLKDDFGPELARLFNVESLAERDDAWRRLSVANAAELSTADARKPQDAKEPHSHGMAHVQPPAPVGATAVSRNRRINTQGELTAIPAQPNGSRRQTTPPGSSASSAPASARDSSRPTAPARAPANDFSLRADENAVTDARGRARHSRTRKPQRKGNRMRSWLTVALGLAGVVAMGIGAVAFLSTHRAQTPPGPLDSDETPTRFHPAQPIRAEQSAPDPASHPTPPTSEANPAAKVEPTAPPPTAAATTSPDPTPTDRTRRPRAGGPDASALTRALRRQHTKLEACFNSHSVALEGHATTQLIFDLAQDGSQTKVELSPPLLAKTELGQCLLKVARGTRFPPQPRPISFAIPLTASTNKP